MVIKNDMFCSDIPTMDLGLEFAQINAFKAMECGSGNECYVIHINKRDPQASMTE